MHVELHDENDRALIEKLAALEHERWAHWQKYMHDKGIRQKDGALLLPAELVDRWERQIKLHYQDLTDGEKESDREQVKKYFPLLLNWIKAQSKER